MVVPDVGTPTLWAARYLRMNGSRRLIGSFNHGSMANALPQAIGARRPSRTRQVVAFSGDGGLAMLIGELLTLRQQRLPVKVVVLNNGSLGFVELEMKADGIVNFGTDLDNPSFADVANAMGIHGIRVERPSELDPALREAFAHPGPALVDVRRAPSRAGDPAGGQRATGRRVHPLGHQKRPERRRQRRHRRGQDQPPTDRPRVALE